MAETGAIVSELTANDCCSILLQLLTFLTVTCISYRLVHGCSVQSVEIGPLRLLARCRKTRLNPGIAVLCVLARASLFVVVLVFHVHMLFCFFVFGYRQVQSIACKRPTVCQVRH